MLVTNARIETMVAGAEEIASGYLRLAGGKIADIGEMADLPSVESEEVLNVSGATVMPGLIDAHTHLGMWENALGLEGDDGNESTDPITPQMRAIDGVNPTDLCFTEAVASGVTTVLTGPGSANPIAGSWCAMKTYGRQIDQMVLNANVGMKFSLGENPKMTYHDKGEMPSTRMGIAALMREQLHKARRYLADVQKAEADEDCDLPEYDAKCEALIPVLTRNSKAFFHAHRTDDIFTAVRIAKEFSLDCVIIHGTAAYEIADVLAAEQIPVIAGPVIGDRSKPELQRQTVQNIPLLHQAGVSVAICTDHPEVPIQYLPLTAGLCIKAGLPQEQALELLTRIPAEICGIADRVGTLEVGKDADLLVCSGDLFSVYTSPDYVIAGGAVVDRFGH